MFIGDMRRQLFVPADCDWNGVVRDITARCETSGMEVDPEVVHTKMQEFYRGRATLALIQMELSPVGPVACRNIECQGRCGLQSVFAYENAIHLRAPNDTSATAFAKRFGLDVETVVRCNSGKG